jgi:3-oxoacyl-[acyl-carrier protein] reductase
MSAMAGKRVLVTGAASGIGRAIAIAFATQGARVVLADRHRAEETAGDILRTGSEPLSCQTDVSDEDQVLRLFRTIDERLGGLDVLVNNAGIFFEKPLLETTTADYDRLMGVNLRGVFLVGREALRLMVRQNDGGRVVNVASELAYLGRANASLYSASKNAVLVMTRSWAREFAPNILVNAVAPGPTDTPMLNDVATSPEIVAKGFNNPLGRIGRPEEIAAVALFLAGPDASFMTGQCVSPNGGAAMF